MTSGVHEAHQYSVHSTELLRMHCLYFVVLLLPCFPQNLGMSQKK